MNNMNSNLSRFSLLFVAGHFLGSEGPIEEAPGLVSKSNGDVAKSAKAQTAQKLTNLLLLQSAGNSKI